ncbi:type II toxin-antitoxin system RelB/DinJ family antitoxin [bacterium]|nr:type II toxin-antitoxin system RelB/DinJ family antitoxin [bacterium]
MAQTNLCIRMDEKIKKQFDYLCNELGFTMSTAINMFVKAVIRENRIPFELSLDIPNEETLKAIEDAENGNVIGPFYSTDDLMKSLLSDEDED